MASAGLVLSNSAEVTVRRVADDCPDEANDRRIRLVFGEASVYFDAEDAYQIGLELIAAAASIPGVVASLKVAS